MMVYLRINDFFINGKFDLGQFSTKLEEVAYKRSITYLQAASKKKIFESISFNEFKNCKKLNKIEIALLN